MSRTYKIFISTNDQHKKLKIKFETNGSKGNATFKGGKKDETSKIKPLFGNNEWKWESTDLPDQTWRFKEVSETSTCKGCKYKYFLEYEVIGATGPGPGSGTGGDGGD